MNTINSGHSVFKYYSSVVPKQVEWLWYPYIPYGKLTIIQGDPGEGKSTFILNIAAALSTGGSLPDGSSFELPQNVVYQCAEDDAEDTIKPRLLAAGADCNRIAYIVDDNRELNVADDRIELTIKQTNARLFILDPLQSYLTQEGDMCSMGHMRSLLGKLSLIAARYKCAIVLICHMSKSESNKKLYRSLGSIDIVAIARSVLMVSRDESDSTIRYVYPIKSSLAEEGDGVAFKFGENGKIEWIETSKIEDFLNVSIPGDVSKRDICSERLIEMLKQGPMPCKEIMNELKSSSIAPRTINKAKKDLEIESVKIGNTWYWRLPGNPAGEA